MSATSLQVDLIAALDSQTTAGRRIYYGTRLQTSALPAITFEIVDGTRIALGAQNTLCAYTVTFNAVADTSSAAAVLDAEIRTHLPSVVGFTFVCTQFGTTQEPQPETGDEAGLYIVTSVYTFYQDGP